MRGAPMYVVPSVVAVSNDDLRKLRRCTRRAWRRKRVEHNRWRRSVPGRAAYAMTFREEVADRLGLWSYDWSRVPLPEDGLPF